jgi:hypothetical protein
MIKPTVGRVVWFYPSGSHPDSQPLAAHIAAVWGDHCINVMVIGHNGVPWSHPPTSVMLVQEGDERPKQTDGNNAQHCAWMPYQHGQAAKTEAAQREAAEARKAAFTAGEVQK